MKIWNRIESYAFPAYAGMNRPSARRLVKPVGVPRVCGDEPGLG